MHNQKPITGGNESSEKVIVLIHGRGGNSVEIMSFAEQFFPELKFISIQADESNWFPYSFSEPRDKNEPYLSSALDAVDRAVKESGVSKENLFIMGFSQGACLAAEYASRNPDKYGGIICFSGGLIGKEVKSPERSMEGTKIVFGCSEEDPFIPLPRVKESVTAFKKSGADVREHIYPGSSHTITEEEIYLAREIIET